MSSLFDEEKEEQARQARLREHLGIKRPVRSLTSRPRGYRASDGGSSHAPKQVPCPFCRETFSSDALKAHLASAHPPGRHAESAPQKRSLRVEKSESQYKLPADRANPWTTCQRCGEQVKRTHLDMHQCPEHRIYVHAVSSLGTTAAEFIERLRNLVIKYPGRTAWQLASILTRQYGRPVDGRTVNSVLYSFRNKPFRRIPEGDGSDDDRDPPKWYHLRAAVPEGGNTYGQQTR